jgi:hypothetical protein
MRTLALGLLIATSTLAYADPDKPTMKDPKPNCHALDESGKAIVELVGAKTTMDCTTKLLAAVKEAKCNDAAMNGKIVNYQQVFDAGAIAGKPVKQKAMCTKKDVKK